MKKTMLLCAALLAMLVSCSKDYESMIIGTWNCESVVEERVYSDGTIGNVEQGSTAEMTFHSDGTFTGTWYGGFSLVMVMDSSGNDFHVETRSMWDHYIIEGDKLIMIGNGNIRSPFTIKSLSSKKCILVQDFGGVTVTRYDSPELTDNYGLNKITYTLKKK